MYSDRVLVKTVGQACARLLSRLAETIFQETLIPLESLPDMASQIMSSLLRLPSVSRTHLSALLLPKIIQSISPAVRSFSSTPFQRATFNQVLRGCRVEQRARKARSPALVNRPELKGVCLRVGVVKPKKPNSGERKVARLRLSSGKLVTAYIPGEGKGSLESI